jgi:pimeloyl-ACP methyl ester carboxylesterase
MKDYLAQDWFDAGERIRIDSADSSPPLWVFRRCEGDIALGKSVTFLPGFPDGSFGWARVLPHLPDASEMPKLFVEYVGQGDSDKPRRYPYGVQERADLIEAHWNSLSMRETDIVSFDFSSLVVLELLSRRLDRMERGVDVGPRIGRVILMNGGLWADAHSHPWFTTPLLKTGLGLQGAQFAQHSLTVFSMMVRILWSSAYQVTHKERVELHSAIARRGGAAFMSLGAGFVEEHKRFAGRLDFGRLYDAFAGKIQFLVAGSEKDPFEHRQIRKARRKLGKSGLETVMLPGGHLTTSEHPRDLATTITEFLQR